MNVRVDVGGVVTTIEVVGEASDSCQDAESSRFPS